MLTEDAIYLAGLFDGEGCVQFKRYKRHRKGRKNPTNALSCTLDVAMVDKPTIEWIQKATGVGNVNKRVKNKSPSSKPHWKDQWRWNCSHKDAFKVALKIAPYSITKKEALMQIIYYYAAKKVLQRHGL
tara:strand:+ start:381 stop:767 length:387 start_codon:yes stop_codon:yes gene_type:complete